MAPSRIVKSIRLTDMRIEAILERLDACTSSVECDARSAERYPCNIRGCVIHLTKPGSSRTTPYLVPTRNISATGLSFLHGCFVYPGTRCFVQLISPQGTWENVEALVVRCSYAQDMVHEVALKFRGQINPSRYCAEASPTRILLVDGDPSIARLAIMMLEKLHADVDHVDNGSLALALARQTAYDAVIMDIEIPEMDSLEAVRTLREQAYVGLIVASTVEPRPEARRQCMDAGCNMYVKRPYARDTLEQVIRTLRQEAKSRKDEARA